jgi:hypothetical protein
MGTPIAEAMGVPKLEVVEGVEVVQVIQATP